jgi:hypothetical protein
MNEPRIQAAQAQKRSRGVSVEDYGVPLPALPSNAGDSMA